MSTEKHRERWKNILQKRKDGRIKLIDIILIIKDNKMKHTVKRAKSTQSAISEIGREEKSLYYLIIGEGDNKVIINIGEKTYEKIGTLVEEEKLTLTDKIPKK